MVQHWLIVGKGSGGACSACVCVGYFIPKQLIKAKLGAEHVTRKTQINKLLYPTHAFLFFSTMDGDGRN
jgi:hypothetical protein